MQKYIPLLKKTLLFSELNEEEILYLIELLSPKVKEFKKGNFILQSGDISDEIGLLVSGTIIISQEDIWGHRSIINKLPAGNTFAEPFAVGKVPLNLSIEANDNCIVMLFKFEKLLSLDYLTDPVHNKLVKNLVNVLVNKAFNLNAKISHMNKRSTREKLLSYLSSQSQKNHTLEFDIPFDRQQLADYLGVERSAMSVELSKLKKDGILDTKKNHFKINIT